MGHVLLTLLLCSVSVSAAPPTGANPGHFSEIPPVALLLDFEQRPAETILAQAKQQAEAILEPSGLRLEWKMLDEVRLGEDFADLAVIRFKGTCRPASIRVRPMPDTGRHRAALASTQISDGQILAFSQVECDTLREYLASTGSALNSAQLDEKFARALARVMAHELFHIFSRRSRHSSSGVAQGSYTRFDLLQEDFALDPRDSSAIAESEGIHSEPESHR